MSKTLIVFGNPDLKIDSLPVRLLPALKKALPDWDIRHLDPNEEWEVPAKLTVLDTVIGLAEPRVFEGLNDFSDSSPRVSMHDYDAYTNLKLMMKIGKVERVKIIGLPPEATPEKALSETLRLIRP